MSSSKLARKQELQRLARKQQQLMQRSSATADEISAARHVERAELEFTRRSRVIRKRKLHLQRAMRTQVYTLSDKRDSYTSRDIVTTDSYTQCSASDLALVDTSSEAQRIATERDRVMHTHEQHTSNCKCADSDVMR